MLFNRMLSVSQKVIPTAPEGVSFDGVSDYLSRSSDLTGNADGKTFTFSAWVYATTDDTDNILIGITSSGSRFSLAKDNSEYMTLIADNSANTVILNVRFKPLNTKFTLDTWIHVLVSIDLTNTANRHIYINDTSISPIYTTYINDSIDFTNTSWGVAGTSSVPQFHGRLSHLYLDYTYRDLSVEANRRWFIDADLKPAANQASLSPILYLPLTDADTAGTNLGTGGDFTINGVLDTAQRGPNQWNCVASEFDGSADYLTNSSCSITNSKVFSGSITYRVDANDKYIFMGRRASTGQSINFIADGNFVRLYLTNDSNVQIAKFTIQNAAVHGAHHHLAFCIDTDNQSGSKVFLDGVDTEVTFDTFVAGGTFNIVEAAVGAQYLGNNKWDGMLGELYLDDAYIDLASDNIFWDADANRPKPVRQVLDETSNTPLIAMPLIANNAGLNLGTGGDFTVNSGPYTGARGGSEYWARSADLDGATGYFSKILANSTSKVVSLVYAVRNQTTTTPAPYHISMYDGSNVGFRVYNNTTRIRFDWFTTPTASVLDFDSGIGDYLNTGQWNIIFLSIDLANTGNRNVWVNGVDVGTTGTWATYVNTAGNINNPYLGNFNGSSNFLDGNIASAYLTTDYIDFSQEANRNIFVDQLGYPKDLTPAIDAGDIPTPLIYMKFDDPNDLGLNSGTGGDFTVNGTVTQGADVDLNA